MGTVPAFPEQGETIISNCHFANLGEGNPATYSQCFFNAIDQNFPSSILHSNPSPNDTYNYNRYQSTHSGTIPPQCSQFCYISALEVQLNYWPTPYPSQTAELNATAVGNLSAQITPPPPSPSTVVRDGFTFISPSVYVVYSGLEGVNDVFGRIGSSYDNLTIGYHPSELSTVNWCNTCGVTQALNFQDFNTPVQWSVISEQYGCAFYGHSYSTHLLPQSHPPADFVTDYNDLSEYIGFDSTNLAQDWVLRPVLDLPRGLTDVDPAWKGCRKWTGVWDPPRPLFSVDGPGVVDWGSVPKPQVMPQPAITPAAPVIHSEVPAMAPAAPQLPAKQTPAPQAPNVDPGPDSSSGSTDPGQPSPGDNPGGDSPDSTGTSSGANPPGSDSHPVDDSGQHEPPPDPAGDPKGDGSSGSTDTGPDSDPPGSSAPEPVNDSDPQQLPSPQAAKPIDSSAENSDSGSEGPNSGVGDPGNGDNPKPVDPAVGNGGDGQSGNDESGGGPKPPDSNIGNSGDGQPSNDGSGGNPQPGDPAVGNGGNGQSDNHESGSDPISGNPAVENGGDRQPGNGGSEDAPSIPTGPSGTPGAVNPSPKGISTPDLIPAPFVVINPSPKPVLTVAGSLVAIDHSGNVAIGGSTLSAGGSGSDISGTPVSVLPNQGGLLVNGKTIPVPPPATQAPNGDPVVGVVAAGKTWTPAGPSAVAADGQTLYLGSSAVDIAGTPVSLVSAGIVAGPSTIAMPVKNQQPVAWMAAGQPFTKLGQDIIVAEGQTLSLGSEPKVIGGKTFSWGSGGLVVGTSTLGVPSLDQFAPTAGPAAVGPFAAAGETFTPVAGGQIVVDGVTVTPGEAPKTVDGKVISLGDTGMMVDGSTFAIPSATLTGASGSYNVFTAGSQTITSLSPTAFAISGQTFTSGGPAATISGHTFSFGASGVIIDSSSTIALPTVVPLLSPKLDSDFDTFSKIASNVVAIDGVTITQGAPPKTVDGEIVSWGSDDLVVGTSTVALSTGTQGVDELGSLILGGFGPEETGSSASPSAGESATATNLFESAAERSRGLLKGWQSSWLRVFIMIIAMALYI